MPKLKVVRSPAKTFWWVIDEAAPTQPVVVRTRKRDAQQECDELKRKLEI